MNDIEMIEARLRSFVAAADDADWQDVLSRAEATPVAQRRRRRPASQRRWRPVLIVAVAVAAIAGAGVAIAAGFGAFNGISAAQHPQGPADKLDPGLLAAVDSDNAFLVRGGNAGGQLLPDSARFVRQLASGERVYVLLTTDKLLCVLIAGRPGGSNPGNAISCGDPLNQNEPTTIGSEQTDPSTHPLAYGVAIDGAISVSFKAGGAEETVPVEHNVWAYEGASGALQSLTVHYADGSSQTLLKGRPQTRH